MKEPSSFDEDLKDLTSFSERLEKFIKVERHFVSGGLVLSLNSKYGTGKTTFLEMWKDLLLRENPDRIVVKLNAWEGDYIGNPLFSLMSELIESIKDPDKEEFKKSMRELGYLGMALGSQIVEKHIGINFINAEDSAAEKMSQYSFSSFSNFEDSKEAMKVLKETLKEFIELQDAEVLFLIDELDRCRPDYAISYLETIKHIFDIKGAVFILAIDRKHLQNSAETAFGSELEFDEYFRKFVHREINLPESSFEHYEEFVKHYLLIYTKLDSVRNCDIANRGEKISYNAAELFSNLKISQRQLQEIFRIGGHVLHDLKGMKKWRDQDVLLVLYLATLKICDPSNYQKIGEGNLKISEVAEVLDKQVNNSRVFGFLFSILYHAETVVRKSAFGISPILTKHMIKGPPQEMTVANASEVYKKIEDLDSMFYTRAIVTCE